MVAKRKILNTSIKILLIGLLVSFALLGCSSVDSNTIVSENIIDYNKDSRLEKLVINMIEGKYRTEPEGGSEISWDWEGNFVLQLIDSKGGVLSSIDLNKTLNQKVLNFKGRFAIEFDDYNKDGNIDFAIGHYTTGNRFEYALFTITNDGKIEVLPVKEGKIISYYEGYSTRFEKTENKGFTAQYFDISLGKNIEVIYVWKDHEFVIENMVEAESGKPISDSTVINEEDTGKEEEVVEEGVVECDMLASMSIQNLNGPNREELVLPLGEEFTAACFEWSRPDGFEFKDDKNKSLEQLYEYKIYNKNGDEVGWFGLIERDQEDDEMSLPDNLQFEDLRYKGPTKLGSGKIYLLWFDLPEEQVKEDIYYYQEYFAFIPVENEDLAYSLKLKVPSSDKLEAVFSYIRKIIIRNEDIEQIAYELFENGDISKKDTETFFQLLPYLDWGILAGISDETFFNIINWLQNYNYESVENVITVFNSTNGLDGAYSEAFSNMLKGMFLKDEPKFISALIGTEEKQKELICFYLVYALEGEEDKETIEYLKNGLTSGKYIGEEKQVIEFILETLNVGV
jgi:hypothetical protein